MVKEGPHCAVAVIISVAVRLQEPTAPASAGENAPALSSIRPHNYTSQGKQWKPTDSSLSKLDWIEYFQIFSRKQSRASQALMSVISIICFSIQLQLKAAKFFSTHYGTK